MAEASNTKIHTIYIAIIVILVLAIAGEFYYFHTRTLTRYEAMQGSKRGTGATGGARMAMTPQKPPQESQQQMQQLTAGTDTSTTQKTFNITGGNFYFVPKNIIVNKGDQVTLVMTNVGGFHDLVIDELGVKTPVVQTGNAVTATFTASRSGSFVYYCSVPNHRKRGMWGTLTVK